MLLKVLFTVPGIVALLTAFFTGSFHTLAFLWVLPVSYLAALILLAAAVFLTAWLMAQAVDLSKPQEEDSKPYRFLIDLIAEAAIPLLSVKMHVQGLEKTPKEGRFMLVCNHLNEMDPVVLLHYFRKSQLTFISKQENQNMFMVGKLMHKIQCQLLNRENDREALKTILKCVQIIQQDKASLAVFPEGYIKPDRKLHHFRSGVFKIAQKAGVPIVICTLKNTADIVRNGLRMKPTNVTLHLVDVIPAEELKGVTTVEIADRVYEMMIADLGEDWRYTEE